MRTVPIELPPAGPGFRDGSSLTLCTALPTWAGSDWQAIEFARKAKQTHALAHALPAHPLISMLGAIPNMRRQVRLRCAESAHPQFCAASVHDNPPIAAPTADSTRAHSR